MEDTIWILRKTYFIFNKSLKYSFHYKIHVSSINMLQKIIYERILLRHLILRIEH